METTLGEMNTTVENVGESISGRTTVCAPPNTNKKCNKWISKIRKIRDVFSQDKNKLHLNVDLCVLQKNVSMKEERFQK